jgi:hypothetical protein
MGIESSTTMIAAEPSIEPACAIDSKSNGTSMYSSVPGSTGAEDPPGNQHLIERPSGGPPARP